MPATDLPRMSALRRLFRRGRAVAVPGPERCNQGDGDCPNKAVVYETPMGEPSMPAKDREIRRCIEHPPPRLAESVARGDRCPQCGRGYWPDMLHLDCPPGEPVRDVAAGCQRMTSAVETGED